MSMSVNEASAVLRAAVRDTIRKRSWMFLVQGATLAAAGVLALLFPAFASSGVTVLIGWLLIVAGIVQGVSLIGVTKVPYFWLDLVAVALAIMVGWLLATRPEAGLTAITFLMLVFFMVGGIQRVIFALMIRPMPDWGWVLASGLVAIACAMILFQSLPEAADWLLGILLGLNLIAVGGAQAWLAWRLRKAVDVV
jgi:uncharacterized membrane protein HdeD (DUF308 family)